MNVLHFDSEASWLQGIVRCWRDRLRITPELRHCLASGHTPLPIYRAMTEAVEKGQVSFSHASIFALDEFGGLQPDDPGLCRNMLQRDLIGGIDLPKSQFHFFNADAKDLKAECRAYDKAVGSGFDLVLLGIGLNGHLGMNEPGSQPDCDTRRVDLEESTIRGSARYVKHQHLPRWGLTVGMRQFFASKEVWLVATGGAKASIIQRLVRGEISDQVPASLLRRHPNCWLFLDQQAGALLA